MTENSISSVQLPQHGNNSPKKDITKITKNYLGEPSNKKQTCTNPTVKTVKICTSDVEKCSSASPSNVPYQQTDELTSSEQAEIEQCDTTAPQNRSLASEVLEKARTRFDMFWGKSKPNPEDSNQ